MSADTDKGTDRNNSRRHRRQAEQRPAGKAVCTDGTPNDADGCRFGVVAAAGCDHVGSQAGDGKVAAPKTGQSQLLAAGWQERVLWGNADVYDDACAFKPTDTLVESMFAHFDERGVETWSEVHGDLTLEWCWSPIRRKDGSLDEPSRNWARNRQRLAQAVFTQAARLGAQVDPATAAGKRISRTDPDEPARLLADWQLQRVCDVAVSGTAASRRPLLVAMFLSGGSAAEAAAVRVRDVDLDAGTVAFAGPYARVCALDDWSVAVIARYLRANPDTEPHDRLCVRADTPAQAAAGSVSRRLWKIIKDARLASRCGVTPRSIRLTAARKVLERDGIVAAARFLGSPSLDNTAELLGHDWQHHNSIAAADAPPREG